MNNCSNSPTLTLITVIALTLVPAAAVPAYAHQGAQSTSTLRIADDAKSASYALELSSPQGEDVMLPSELDRMIAIEAPTDCHVARSPAVDRTPTSIRLRWQVSCRSSMGELSLDYRLLFVDDPMHQAALVVVGPEGSTTTVLSTADHRFEWRGQEEAPSGHAAFVTSGIYHILFGWDHVAFVLALLIVVAVRRDGHGFHLRDLKSAVRDTLAIVTAFTIAHSITLVATALDVIDLPSRLVESVIALSIVYVAVENIFRKSTRGRRGIIVAFGLLHGMGFASMLAELLPSEGIVIPVILFNLGVELGQLLIVATALPALVLAARSLGASDYGRRVVPLTSAALAVAGLLWLVDRALALG